MSRRQQLVRAAAQLHTAAADALTIAAQREAASSPINATDADAAWLGTSEPVSGQTPLRRAWISRRRPPESDLRFEPSVPQPARIYSYWLGGKDHYPADRVVAEEVIAHRPQVVAGAHANHALLSP